MSKPELKVVNKESIEAEMNERKETITLLLDRVKTLSHEAIDKGSPAVKLGPIALVGLILAFIQDQAEKHKGCGDCGA